MPSLHSVRRSVLPHTFSTGKRNARPLVVLLPNYNSYSRLALHRIYTANIVHFFPQTQCHKEKRLLLSPKLSKLTCSTANIFNVLLEGPEGKNWFSSLEDSKKKEQTSRLFPSSYPSLRRFPNEKGGRFM
jgi:hypothetical protein